MVNVTSPLKNIVLFLNGERGLAVMASLVSRGYDIAAIVTHPNFGDKNFKDSLKKLQIKHLPSSNINSAETVNCLSGINSDLFIVAGYPTIFKGELLSLPQYGSINLHAGRLPYYRGGSPLNWQIINGEEKIGLSVICLDKGIDSGPIYSEAIFQKEAGDTIADLHSKANRIFPSIVEEALLKIIKKVTPKVQDDKHAQYWHQRSDRDGHLFFNRVTSAEAINFVNALTRPYSGAWAKCDDKVVRIYAAEILDEVIKGSPGRVCNLIGRGPLVICLDKAILITDYVIEGSDEKLSHGEYLE